MAFNGIYKYKAFRRLLITALLLVVLIPAGCRDDLIYDPEIGEGESLVSMTMGFEQTGLSVGSTRADGQAVNTIENVTVLAYNSNGSLYKVWRSKDGDFKYETDENSTMPGDMEPNPGNPPYNGTDQAEARTPKVTFSLPDRIPFGRYYIYAVANLDVTDAQVETPEQLKEISLNWNNDVRQNNAMFGYFCSSGGIRSQGFDAELLTVNKNDIQLWSWIRRCVSKVTVAFDGRRLNPNVTIYLKSVQIKDVPKSCFLGKENVPSSKSDLESNGETIVYGTGNDYNTWQATVTVGNPVYGAMGRHTANVTTGPDGSQVSTPLTYDQQIIYQHGETAPALYFFENMQGTGKAGTVTDKRQDVNGENKSVSYPNGNNGNLADGFKDGKEFGTYIEVQAFYVNTGSGGQGSGDIIYRFMLGQDDHLDYNAARNHHYKLTMSFNGNANDVDWHIVYEQPDISFPRPYYISYLYNRKMMCPLTVKTGKSEIDYITATIVSNAWAPLNPGNLNYYSASDKPEEYPYNGFLSLHETESTVLKGTPPYNMTSNKAYYYEAPQRGYRKYEDFDTDGPHTTTDAKTTDLYYTKLTTDNDGMHTYEVSIPMYTRAKEIIKQTGYTGNNPYESYQRAAKVRIAVHLTNGDSIVSEEPLDIIQMRRIVNPKGVFRKWNSTKSFHVTLKYRDGETDPKFTNLKSQSGPWKAYVVQTSGNDPNAGTEDAHGMITFSGQEKIFKSNNPMISDTIYGENGEDIDFSMLFKGKCSSDKVSRHAVVRVEYHNYTCFHLIFVRQGNAPVKLTSGATYKWHNSNRMTKYNDTDNPIDEGSLFKFGNWDWPIASSCNVNCKSLMINPDDFLGNGGASLDIVGKTGKYSWNDNNFTHKNATSPSTDYFENPSDKTRVPGFWQYASLYTESYIEQGFGVLYGDDAVETLDEVDKAYGYIRGGDGKNGMRGCFVYNSINGVNVFFPIGNSGYGHRKNNGEAWGSNRWPKPTTELFGLLRYSCNPRWGYFDAIGGNYPDGVASCPLFYDIFRRPGAIYWFRNQASTGSVFQGDLDVKDAVAWDFNYFTFDFYAISANNLGNGADACFVRCITDD